MDRLRPIGLRFGDACQDSVNYPHVPVAQRIEHSPPKRGVAGSSPAGDAIFYHARDDAWGGVDCGVRQKSSIAA